MKATIDDLKLFLRIVELGSLRQVAVEQMTEPSTISRRLTALESRLNTKLIERSKVHSFPTDIGKSYYQRLRVLLEQMDILEEEVSGNTNTPTGLLRVSCPVDFGSAYIAPWLHDLQYIHPGLQIELLLNDQYVNLVENGIDVAIRIGQLNDSSMRARHLGDMQMAIVASKTYFEKHSMPTTPEALEEHYFVLYNWLKTPTLLHLSNGSISKQIRMNSRFAINNVGAILNVVSQGAGLHFAPRWMLQHNCEKYDLVEVLPDWEKNVYPVHALYITSEIGFLPAKTRAFIDLLVENMRKVPK